MRFESPKIRKNVFAAGAPSEPLTGFFEGRERSGDWRRKGKGKERERKGE